MYDSGPSDEELKAFCLTREDVEDTSDFEIWPENWMPFLVFSEVSTQWRVGAGGATGLDYVAVKVGHGPDEDQEEVRSPPRNTDDGIFSTKDDEQILRGRV
jgi:hypothetical protein